MDVRESALRERFPPREVGALRTSVVPVGMGCSLLGAFWQGRSMREGAEAVRRALWSGLDVFDTADCYARGISERVLGRVVAQAPDAVVCTKVGLVKTPRAAFAAARANGGQLDIREAAKGFRRGQAATRCYQSQYVEWAVARSLRRLRIEAIDIVFMHAMSAEDVRAGAFMQAVSNLRSRGSTRAWGISCDELGAMEAALDLPGIGCLQVPAQLALSAPARALLSRADERGVAVFLNRIRHPAVRDASSARSMSEAMAVLLALPGVAVALMGMSSPEHVSSNVAELLAMSACGFMESP